MSDSVSPTQIDPISERWLAALREHQPGLPQPVAVAMVDAAARGNLGSQLRVIEQALINFEGANLEELTGSEARVLIAILRQMHNELSQLENRLNHLWEYK
jgi:hypothetical protein